MNQDIRLVVCDIDGTITEKGEKPKPKTHEALRRIHDEGILLGLASGRPVDSRLINKFRDWGLDMECDIVIGFNGNQFWDRFNRKTEEIELLKKKEIDDLLSYLWDLDVNVITYENGYDRVLAKRMDWLLKASQERNKSNVVLVDRETIRNTETCKLEIRYDEAHEEELMKIVNEHACDDYTHVKTFTSTLEFMKPGIDKGKALRIICERLDIPLDKVMTCGDMDNDTEMIRTAGIGVCMLNGCKASKEAADYITELDVEHDGLGEFFFQHLFHE
ncbi:MAG: HAD family phosphatase [Erysipelotrichaceae bacterium]|nr:HAD family phosphatase [Erysipelotrichaceae bacterium]